MSLSNVGKKERLQLKTRFYQKTIIVQERTAGICYFAPFLPLLLAISSPAPLNAPEQIPPAHANRVLTAPTLDCGKVGLVLSLLYFSCLQTTSAFAPAKPLSSCWFEP